MALPLAVAPLKVTVAWVSPAAAVTVVGAVGSPAGVTLLDAVDAAPGPVTLVATTVNV